MSQNVIPGREYASRSGNGMQGTKQTRKTQSSRSQSSSAARTSNAYTTGNNSSAVECDISEGSRRVSRWLYEMQSYSGVDGMYDGAGDVYLTNNVYQQAVNQVKQAQVEAEMAEGEETDELAETEEGAVTGGYSDSRLEYMERLLEDIKKSREANAKNKNSKKRALNYNHSKVSGSIMRAKSVTQANNALSSAKSNLISLSRKRGSKLYNSKEVEIAISHAKRMVRTARKKVYNIKVEERQKKLDTDVENGAERKHGIIKRQQRGSGAAAENAKIEKEMFRLKKMMRSNREQRKNRHRGEENQELLMADMEYLKRKIELMREEHEVQQAEAAEVRDATTGGMEGTVTGGESSGETVGGGTQLSGGTEAGSGATAAEVASSGFEAMV